MAVLTIHILLLPEKIKLFTQIYRTELIITFACSINRVNKKKGLYASNFVISLYVSFVIIELHY